MLAIAQAKAFRWRADIVIMEIVIFGKPPGQDIEALLVSEAANLKSKAQALKVIAELENVHGCRDCRVFEWDGSAPKFHQCLQL